MVFSFGCFTSAYYLLCCLFAMLRVVCALVEIVIGGLCGLLGCWFAAVWFGCGLRSVLMVPASCDLFLVVAVWCVCCLVLGCVGFGCVWWLCCGVLVVVFPCMLVGLWLPVGYFWLGYYLWVVTCCGGAGGCLYCCFLVLGLVLCIGFLICFEWCGLLCLGGCLWLGWFWFDTCGWILRLTLCSVLWLRATAYLGLCCFAGDCYCVVWLDFCCCCVWLCFCFWLWCFDCWLAHL